MRFALIVFGLLTALSVRAETTLVTGAPTAIKAYAKSDGRYHVLLVFENTQYLGVNTHDNTTNCQFWTNSEVIFDTALTAVRENTGVKLVYVGRGATASSSCQVVSMSLTE